MIVGLAAGGLGLGARAVNGLDWLEQRSVDARFAIRGLQPAPRDVVVVALDQYSYDRLPLPPLPRRLDAQVMDNLHRAGARVIAFDFALERPSSDPLADRVVINAARRSAPVVVSVTALRTGGFTQPLAGTVPFGHGVYPGSTLLRPDSDGATRSFPGPLRGVESFATVAAARYLDRPGAVNRARQSRALVDYPGPPGTAATLSLYDVLHDRFDPTFVRGRVAVVGESAPVLGDVHHTPAGGGPMAGPELQADAIATAISGFPLVSAPPAITAVLLLAVALVVPLAGLRLSTPLVITAGAGALLAWSVATQLAFNAGIVADYSDATFAIAASIAGTLTIATITDSRERRRLRTLFATYAPEVVSGVLAGHGAFNRALAPTAVIAGYRLEAVVGRGGMGVIYRATQLRLNRTVALKLISGELARDPSFRERFKQESHIAASIGHPNVIPVYDAGEDDGLLYIAMPLIEGLDLAQVLRSSGPLDPASTSRILQQVAGALDAAHARGLVHRDVKPANVLLTTDESQHAYLTDFGISKYVDSTSNLTQTQKWVGSLDYLAPEQISGTPVDARADIYALTALLYHCLTGTVPFQRDDEPAKLWAHLNAPRPSAARARAGLPNAIDNVIARGMATDRNRRYPRASDLAAAASRALGIDVEREPITPTVERTAPSPPPHQDGPTAESN